MTAPAMMLDPEALYVVDGGAIYHGRCCGWSAQVSGRDTSGQEVYRLTERDIAEATAEGFAPRCEDCGRSTPCAQAAR